MLKKLKAILKSKKGFTLFELIIAIAIIGILSAVAAPRAIKYVEKAKITADVHAAETYSESIEELILNGDIRVPSTVTSGTSLAAIYVTNSGSQPTGYYMNGMTTISNKSESVKLDIYFQDTGMLKDSLNKPLSFGTLVGMFEDSAKLSTLKYYSGVEISIFGNGSTEYQLIK